MTPSPKLTKKGVEKLKETSKIMKTICIQIGNTDNKLTQQEWFYFVKAIKDALHGRCDFIHFFGGSPNWERWQNVAWVFTITESAAQEVRLKLARIREKFKQDSIAWLEGVTEFV